MARATGRARTTIYRAGSGQALDQQPLRDRMRWVRGRRKKLTVDQPGLRSALEARVEPTTRGDLENPLRWTGFFMMEWRPSPLRRDGRHPNTNRVPGGPGPLTNPLTAWREIPESRNCSSRYSNPGYRVILLEPQGRRVGEVDSSHTSWAATRAVFSICIASKASRVAIRRTKAGWWLSDRREAKSPIGRRGLLPTSCHSSWVIP